MAELLLVPEVAAGATEVVLAEWLAKPGDAFAAGDAIAVLETEKAVVEVEAEGDATLLTTLVAAGKQIRVGSPMALLGTAEELEADLDALLARLGAEVAVGTPAPALREVPDTEEESPAPGQSPAPQVQARPATHDEATTVPGERLFISPLARRMLAEAGIDPHQVAGSGPRGRIRRRDVEAAIAKRDQQPSTDSPVPPAPKAASTPSASSATGWTEVPHSRSRRAVAARLTRSKQDIPHFYVKRTAVIDDLLALRAQLNTHSPAKLSVNDFVVRAVAVAHQAVPEANVTWSEDAMRQFDSVDISVAIASERGLVTPVLRGVEKSSLSAISTGIKGFVEQANAGRLQQKDLEGGSISVTNLGMYGVEEFSAIINPPQSAILAVGAGDRVVRVVDGDVAPVTAMTLVLSVDHRAIDGALAAQWMTALVAALETPMRLVV